MSDLFSEIWMKRYQKEWNSDSEITSALKKISFNSVIGYGFPHELDPRGRIIVEQGEVVDAGPYQGERLNWDLRAKENHWYDWLKREVGNTGLGLAYSTGKLTFLSGDYKSIIKNPDMLRFFIKSFSAMGRVFSK